MSASSMQAFAAPDSASSQLTSRGRLAKIDLGVWTPGRNTATEAEDSAEQTVREMATDWPEGP
jgi:hypothetical protein